MSTPDKSPPSETRHYWCFISYCHADNKERGRQWANWLHHGLETYEVPEDLVGSRNERGDNIPSRIFPVFRDEEELPADAELSTPINKALRESNFMVVICSPAAVESRFVDDEIRTFKKLGKADRILAAIVRGEPNVTDDAGKQRQDRPATQECFPLSLRRHVGQDGTITTQVSEPVGADFRLPDGSEGWTTPEAYRQTLMAAGHPKATANRLAADYAGRCETMKLKIIAGILGISLGVLTKRDRAYQLGKVRGIRFTKTVVAASTRLAQILRFPLRRLISARGTDKVHFTVASPPGAQPGKQFIVDVWAHVERQRSEVERRVQQARPQTDAPPVIRPKGPFKIKRGTTLFVRLRFPDLPVDPPEDVILWEGEIGNASFEVAIPNEIDEGVKSGLVTVHWEGGLQIARVPLQILVAAKVPLAKPTTQPLHHIRKAFASYANPDRDEVLRAIQGMQKILPDLDVFLDVVKLRSGEDWEKKLWQVIPESDVFYLFWSAAAKASTWVEKEWRCALNSRGEEFIDPVPLVSPDEVHPPEELSQKHFNDWILAYRRGRSRAD